MQLKTNPSSLSPISTRQASTVACGKSRNGEEAIETVCDKNRAGLIIQVQVMPAGQLFLREG
jgi:hypothetical protein